MKKNNRLLAAVASLATLALLAGCTSATAAGGRRTGENQNTITLEQAAVIAYDHAGVSEAEAQDKSYERDRDHYEIDFDFNGWEYEYDISLTGEILHSYMEPDDDPKPMETQPMETQPVAVQAITMEEAAAIAYAHAGVEESKALDKSHEKEAKYYEIDFEYDGYDYEYHIGFDGTVLFSHKEPDRDVPPVTQPKEPKATEPKTTEPKATEPKPTEAKTITIEEAAAIAYAHAGVQESKAWDKSYEKEAKYYEIDFEYDGYDYEYHIGFDGAILFSHKEPDRDVPPVTEPKPTEPKPTEPAPTESTTITMEEAVAMAYAHAGVQESKAYDKSYEKDDGCYEIDFSFDGWEYEYKISFQGKVLRSHKEADDDYRAPVAETSPSRISSDEALSIALNHAGVAKSDTREREVEWDDGCWEVSFQAGRTEYEYKISADGKILHHEKEMDD